MQVPPVTVSPAASSGASAAPSEKNARLNEATSSQPNKKLRSCLVCRTRKVRCDKLSPCSNCRRANIACVLPSIDRPPRWARRLRRVANDAASSAQASQTTDPAAAQVMERLRSLETLVKDLSGQLEQANAAASSKAGGSSGVGSPESFSTDHDVDRQKDASLNNNAGNLQNQNGRLVLQDANQSRYVSSGFWSRINDELDGLQLDSRDLGYNESDISEDETTLGKSPTTQELQRTPAERHAFFFGHNLSPSAPDLHELHPLPSQIPFLLDVFSENVNFIMRIVHVPTIAKMVRDSRGSGMAYLSPANEALMFSIYYAAVTSMEEEDVMTNFGFTKTDLNLKYRLGLEHAFGKADFLNVADLVLIQAFAIFLCLVRRHDSPRFVWMMTGLVIRMGQALGLHRDGANFKHLTPYEIEMRRRAWWVLCMLDVRASEDQGSDYTIAFGSFDTKLPLNINDADIEPGKSQTPTEHEGISDMTYPLVSFQMCEVAKEMMTKGAKKGGPDVEEQSQLLNDIYQKLDRGYLQYSAESSNIACWVVVIIARLMMAKMALLIYLPVLFSSSNEHFSDEIKSKLLVAAIENAEYNHALNEEQACRHWRWVYQTYTHWHAIVYLLLEISRRPWSPIVERAWVALHSQWLIPSQSHMDKNLRFWVPLRKLMAKARKHREAELERLKIDTQAAEWLERDDRMIAVPASPGPFPAGSNAVALFRERWRQLLGMPKSSNHDEHNPGQFSPHFTRASSRSFNPTLLGRHPIPADGAGGFGSSTMSDASHLDAGEPFTNENPRGNITTGSQSVSATNASSDRTIGETAGLSYCAIPTNPETWPLSSNSLPWPWPDADPSRDPFANVDVDGIDINMDLDGEVDWYNWVESAKGINWNTGPISDGRA